MKIFIIFIIATLLSCVSTSSLFTTRERQGGIDRLPGVVEENRRTFKNWQLGIQEKEIHTSTYEHLIDPGSTFPAENLLCEHRFMLIINNSIPEIRVVIRLDLEASIEQKTAWIQLVNNTWNNRIKLVCEDKDASVKEYPIVIDIQIEEWNEKIKRIYDTASLEEIQRNTPHFLICVKRTGRAKEDEWPLDDPRAIPHEVGHMIGNIDEYGTVNGQSYICNGSHGMHGTCSWCTHIMHCREGVPTFNNYNLILDEVRKMIGSNNHLANI